MIKLAPSILSADFSKLGQEVSLISEAGSDYIHIDVMDGMFVPNISFGAPIIKDIRKCSDKVFDIHLMIEEPIRYIDDFAKAGADIITIHAEACKHLHRTIYAIKEKGLKVGVSLNPASSCSLIEQVITDIDMVLIMSVNPGFGGQSFIKTSIDKIKQVKKLIQDNNTTCDIQVDGGINLDNVSEIIEAGANIIVAGSSVFGCDDIPKRIKEFKDIFSKYN